MSERTLSIDMRPTSLASFIGSEKITGQLKKLLEEKRIPTAILFSGSSGTGKTTLARIVCKEIDGELVEINASDDTGVDAARVLGETSAHKPLFGKWLVILLDEAHQLSKQAQNALLKHIEDASSTTLWIFCTTEPAKLIPTLKGRCLAFQLGGLNSEQTSELVKRGLKYRKEPESKAKDLVPTLVENNISSPRVILMALERFLGGMDPLAASLGTENPVAIEIARAAFKKNWIEVSTLLQKLTNEEAISTRNIIASYFKSVLLKSGGMERADAIITLSTYMPYEAGLQLSDLCARLYKICNK